jgi:hypothetical protein
MRHQLVFGARSACRSRAWIVAACLGLGLWIGTADVARSQCSGGWDPRRTEGLKFMVNVQGSLALLWGKHRDDYLGTGAYGGGVNLDARGNLGKFHLGLGGEFLYGGDKNHYEVIDGHLGINIVKTGLTGYRYVLSRNSYIIGNYQLTHTRYCPQTQGTASHHFITAGPRFVITHRGAGMGAHLTYRFMHLTTRSTMGWIIELQGYWANLNLFANGEDFTGPKASINSFGGKLTLNYIYTYFTTGFTLGYFADAWSFTYTLGAMFWGA